MDEFYQASNIARDFIIRVADWGGGGGVVDQPQPQYFSKLFIFVFLKLNVQPLLRNKWDRDHISLAPSS